MDENYDNIENRKDVKEELARIDPEKKGTLTQKTTNIDKLWFLALSLLAIGLFVVYYLVRFDEIILPEEYKPMAVRLARGSIFIVLVLLIARSLSIFLFRKIEDSVSQYNIKKVMRLVVAVIILFIILSSVFVNWYGALVSLGILTLILGIALQNPITSFFAWIFLMIRRPYRVGDRIAIGEMRGDVVDVGYFDTTLWEFRGEYLTTDHPSGRLIRFPNSKAFTDPVINFSWPVFPYIWNEIHLQVSYTSDFKFISETMERVVTEELGERMLKRVNDYHKLLKKTAVGELEVNERPVSFFRADDVTWIRASVRYLVDPRKAGTTINILTVKIIEALNKEPARVQFPNGNNR